MRYCTCHHLVGGFSPIASEDNSEEIESDKLRGGFSNASVSAANNRISIQQFIT